jgi:DNA-binding transcriptional regulator YiaG
LTGWLTLSVGQFIFMAHRKTRAAMKPKEYKELKRRLGVVTHTDLARKIGIHFKTAEGWARGMHEPSRIARERIAAALAKHEAEHADRR